MNEFNIINFKSEPKNNFFAPEWNYFLCESYINDIDFNKLTKFLLIKEKEIKKIPLKIRENGKLYDGYTGLNDKSTTVRFTEYNIFNFKNKQIDNIKHNIIKIHNNFLNKLNLPIPNKLYIQSWFNVMRKGEQIKPHIHAVIPDSYLGGNICVKCSNTSTIYINPVNQINEPELYSSKNEVGKITLFQECIPHYTDIHNGEEERITIAFDLSLKKLTSNYIKLL